MTKKYRGERVARVCHYHFRDGAQTKRSLFLPGIALSMLVIAGVGVSQIDWQGLLKKPASNNIAADLHQQTEVSALQESILRANTVDTQDKSLAAVINDKLDDFSAKQEWSVYVSDLNSNKSASINTDKVYDAGSLSKLFLLPPLESNVPADQWDYHWASGYSLKGCVELFLSSEDNQCSDAIGHYVNWTFGDKYNKDLGFINTSFGEGSAPKTNAREIGQLLTQLKTANMLSDMGRRTVFDSLYHQDYVSGIAAACKDCVVANKTTEQGEFVHDAAIVTRGHKSYVVVIMSKGGSLKQINQLAKIIDQELK